MTQGERREGHWKCLTATLACVIIQSNLVTIAFGHDGLRKQHARRVPLMTKVEIEQTIAKETQGLSVNALHEVLDFIQFIKMKEYREGTTRLPTDQGIHSELRALDKSSLAHLEEEFANYKELYPH